MGNWDRWILLGGPESTGGAKPNGFWGRVTMFCHHIWKRVSEGNFEAILGEDGVCGVRRFAASLNFSVGGSPANV